MKVAFATASVSRRAGGLFSSIRDLSSALRRTGAEIRVSAGEDQETARDLASWGDTRVTIGAVLGPSTFGFQPGLSRNLMLDGADLVHLHGLWTYPSLATLTWSRRTRKPRVISAHGMLDPWAMQRSACKKRLAWAGFERRNLQGAACLHALAESEYRAIRALGLRAPVAVIPNGVDTIEADRSHPPPDWKTALPDGARALLFLGRLHPKKGLAPLIEAFARIGADRRGPWHLLIAGWDQAGHEDDLKRLVQDCGLGQVIHFIGPQFGADKSATLAHAEAFVLPSFSEGLPMAVLEAWAFRLPVLMTDACNLPEGFDARAAVRLSMSLDSLTGDLARFLCLDAPALRDMGLRGRALVDNTFRWDPIARQFLAVYDWCCGRAEKPDCVRLD